MSEQDLYYPGPDDAWARRPPAELGMSGDRLREAVAHARSHEIGGPRDPRPLLMAFEKPPYNKILGPTRERGDTSGLVLRHGYIAAEWGDPARADMTFSATKSYLSLVAGLAWDAGRIRDVHDFVRDTVRDGHFEPPHNSEITWHHLLQQTSEWEGTLFGIPDLVDRNRSIGEAGGAAKGTHRDLRAPGTFWEYNDVRINLLGVALLHVWGEPLPDVLKRHVMDPVDASSEWQWHGYRNSWVEVNGKRMQSVPGGGHWGGGIWISTFDHARIGYLLLRRGAWAGRQIVSREWIERSTTPCEVNRTYGYMWWLNTDRMLYPAASPASFTAQGAGGNVVLIEPEHDLVVVTRWVSDVAGVIERVVAAIA